jgi:hypothetical protein
MKKLSEISGAILCTINLYRLESLANLVGIKRAADAILVNPKESQS